MSGKKEVQQLHEDLMQTVTALRHLAEEGFERWRKTLSQIMDPKRKQIEEQIYARSVDAYQQNTKKWDDDYSKTSDPQWKQTMLKNEISAQKEVIERIKTHSDPASLQKSDETEEKTSSFSPKLMLGPKK